MTFPNARPQTPMVGEEGLGLSETKRSSAVYQRVRQGPVPAEPRDRLHGVFIINHTWGF